MDTILQLEYEINALKDSLRAAQEVAKKVQDTLLPACLKYWKQRYGIEIGTIVYLEGVEGRIEEVCYTSFTDNLFGKPTVVLRLKSRNGNYCEYATTTYGEGSYSYKLKSEMEEESK
jgi:hypothetical protein